MKIVVIGGHLSPALAVIERLKNEQIFFLGRKYPFEGDKALSLEYQEIARLNIPFFSINAARLQRKWTKYSIFSLLKFPLGFKQSLDALKKIQPDVVLGFGGYVSIPVVLAAYVLKIPIVIHEQTLEAGFANKFLAKFAKKICISFESSRKHFPSSKTILTGNPLRKEIINVAKISKEKHVKPSIYVTGGSAGSHIINVLINEALEELLRNYTIIHQTGDSRKFNDFNKLEERKNQLSQVLANNYTIKKFLNEKEAALAIRNADLVISRSGINTISELIYLQTPALLIPLPFAQKNEQFKNGQYLKNMGLAEIINQNDLNRKLFLTTINQMIGNKQNYILKQQILTGDSVREIVEVLHDVSKEKAT